MYCEVWIRPETIIYNIEEKNCNSSEDNMKIIKYGYLCTNLRRTTLVNDDLLAEVVLDPVALVTLAEDLPSLGPLLPACLPFTLQQFCKGLLIFPALIWLSSAPFFLLQSLLLFVCLFVHLPVSVCPSVP